MPTKEEGVCAELDSHRVPLDRNAPIPIAGHVLRKGFRPKSRFCACAERWPELRFEMTTGYLDFVET